MVAIWPPQVTAPLTVLSTSYLVGWEPSQSGLTSINRLGRHDEASRRERETASLRSLQRLSLAGRRVDAPASQPVNKVEPELLVTQFTRRPVYTHALGEVLVRMLQ